MKNKSMYFSFLVVIAGAVAACFIRFCQLIKYTDIKTGLVTENRMLTYSLFICILFCVLICAFYSYKAKELDRQINFIGNKSIYVSLLFLCGTYFFDFVHQCYNCYQYILQSKEQNYTEYNYLISLILVCVFAIFSCYYFGVCAKSVRGTFVDFTKFRFFHLTPFFWGFFKMLMIITDVFDIESVESFLEFLFVMFYCGFALCCASAVEDKKHMIKPAYGFFALSLFLVSISISAPRLLMVIAGKYSMLSVASFSSITYLATGVFALSFELAVYIKNDDKQID